MCRFNTKFECSNLSVGLVLNDCTRYRRPIFYVDTFSLGILLYSILVAFVVAPHQGIFEKSHWNQKTYQRKQQIKIRSLRTGL